MSDHGAATQCMLAQVLAASEAEIVASALKDQLANRKGGRALLKQSELQEQTAEFVRLLRDATQRGDLEDLAAPEWEGLKEMLAALSRSRALQGSSPSETATFVLSFKRPLFQLLLDIHARDAAALQRDLWSTTTLLDRLGLYTIEVHQQAAEQVIRRQQEEMLELSTPVVKLWDGVLALPMIGTLDSSRTQVAMEALLQRLVETGASIAILDITGVPTVDTLTAQHLLKTVAAARLMGAECIISGIRPQIAQTIIHLGVDLGDIITKASLADALMLAIRRLGFTLRKTAPKEA